MLLSACGTSTQPSPPLLTEQLEGRFEARPWTDSRQYSTTAGGTLWVDVTFHGDYNDWLWIEVWRGNELLAQKIATGFASPRQSLVVPVVAGPFELRIWTDKCCTVYTGTIVRPQ
jgi:hypothetical protein